MMALWAAYPPIRVAGVGNDLIRGRASFKPEIDAVAWTRPTLYFHSTEYMPITEEKQTERKGRQASIKH